MNVEEQTYTGSVPPGTLLSHPEGGVKVCVVKLYDPSPLEGVAGAVSLLLYTDPTNTDLPDAPTVPEPPVSARVRTSLIAPAISVAAVVIVDTSPMPSEMLLVFVRHSSKVLPFPTLIFAIVFRHFLKKFL